MKKQIIRLTESDLHKIINETVNKVIMESSLFNDNLEKELKLPYELRKSRMTDEEIHEYLNKVHEKEMNSDFEDNINNNEVANAVVPNSYSNQNVKDDNGRFSGRASYLRGDYDAVPL